MAENHNIVFFDKQVLTRILQIWHLHLENMEVKGFNVKLVAWLMQDLDNFMNIVASQNVNAENNEEAVQDE